MLWPMLVFAQQPPRMYLYPAVLETHENLLASPVSSWAGQSIEGCKVWRGQGGPFQDNQPALFLDSAETKPNYWGRSVKVQGGRTYLVGGWVKNDNAKILFWFHGNYGQPIKRFNQRIYFFSGGSRILENYLSPETKAMIGGDPNAWNLCYRTLEIPEEAGEFLLNYNVGTYFATGRIQFASPFLIDITEVADQALVVDIQADKPFQQITITRLSLRDVIWHRTFDTPVTGFKEKIPDTTFLLSMDQRIFEGYQLRVEYTDGQVVMFTAPKEKTNK